MRVFIQRESGLQSVWFRCWLIGLLIVAMASACSRRFASQSHNVSAPTEVAKVRVSADARIYLNEHPVTFSELKKEFEKLKQVNGGVRFLDESTAGESRQQAQLVRQAIIKAELPMLLR